MKAKLSSKPLRIVTFFVLEVVSIGMGMGVPFFTILLGFPLGWFLPRFASTTTTLSPQYLATLLKKAITIASVTFVFMALIWLPSLSWLSASDRDIANFGIPMILFSPRASFIGWIVLMVLISPFLQLLMTLFGSICWTVLFYDRWKITAISSEEG